MKLDLQPIEETSTNTQINTTYNENVEQISLAPNSASADTNVEQVSSTSVSAEIDTINNNVPELELDLQPIENDNTISDAVTDPIYERPANDKGWDIYATPKESISDKIGKAINLTKSLYYYPGINATEAGKGDVRSMELNAKEVFGELSEDESNELNNLESRGELNYGLRDRKNFSSWLSKGMAKNTRTLMPSIEVMKEGGIGSILAGVAGFVGGGILGLTKGAPVQGALAGLNTGVKLGGGFGSLKESTTLEIGSMYQEMKEFKDNDGNPLDENVLKGTAIVGGVLSGAFEIVGIDAALKTVPGYKEFKKKSLQEFTKEVLKNGFVRTKLVDLGKQYGRSVGTEIATEMLQEVVHIAGGEYAKFIEGNYDKTPFGKHIARTIETGIAAIAPSMILCGVGSGLSVSNVLIHKGMDKATADKIAAEMTNEEKTEFLNNNEDACSKILEDTLVDEHKVEVQSDYYNKLLEVGIEENQAYSASQIMGQYVKNFFGKNTKAFKDWYGKLNLTNKRLDDNQNQPIDNSARIKELEEKLNLLSQDDENFNQETFNQVLEEYNLLIANQSQPQLAKDIENNIQNEFNSTPEELESYFKADVENILLENNISPEELNIEDLKLYGSYTKGLNKKTSDLDVIVQYSGLMREDTAFNILNDAGIKITDTNGIERTVDFNPINRDKSGTIQEHIEYMNSLEKTSYQFAGEKAHTADLFSLDKAKQMLSQKVDAEKVRVETGWFKGVDGKFRFEISDADAVVDVDSIKKYREENIVEYNNKINEYNQEMTDLIKERDENII